jgi:hypothetical protein
MPRKTALHAKMIVTKPSTVPLVSSSMGTPVASKSKPRANEVPQDLVPYSTQVGMNHSIIATTANIAVSAADV